MTVVIAVHGEIINPMITLFLSSLAFAFSMIQRMLAI